MRKELLVTVAAAFVLSSVVAAPILANAQVSAAQMKKDGEIKDPAKADAAIAKDSAKDAKKQAHRAHKQARKAHHKAKLAAKKAEDATKAAASK